MRLALRMIAATFVSLAATGALASERQVAECVDRLVRETPSWGAMKKFRAAMAEKGFSVRGAVHESDPKNGKSWTAYNVQIKGEKRAYRVACWDR